MRTRTHARRRVLALCCAIACGATLAACGGSGDGATASSQDRETARLPFEKCQRDPGVDVRERRTSGPASGASTSRPTLARVDDTKMRAAMRACAKLRDAAFGTLTPEQRQEFRDAFTRFSACMRQHGVDVPAPGPPGEGAAPARRRLRMTPATEAATKACQSKLPNGGKPPGGGGGIFVGPGR